ncbi:uncharacterized protein LOC129789449 [Lutzomyia longipalpis]|uniref:uncharacterized protein LOC129789449 n=1 Tax=Lutzomyia longipalpis TaxID=7200 RepID=UPI002483E3FF|nr:uncharacterized protein LOC129789449 [Lutzomyia longipalpis]
MVITVQEIKWSQTPEEVHVQIFFSKGYNPKRSHIFTSNDFIKINCPPFFREIFLSHPINEPQSRCRLLQNEIRFILIKSAIEEWETLEKIEKHSDNIHKKEDIENMLRIAHIRQQQEAQEKLEKKVLVKRKDVEKIIKRESEIRLKTSENDREIMQHGKNNIEEIQLKKDKEQTTLEKTKELTINSIPHIRSQETITVEFTNRRFPTPKRESQNDLEDEWIRNQLQKK